MKVLFDGIPPIKVSVSLTAERRGAAGVLAGYIIAAEEQGVSANHSRWRTIRTTS